MRFLIAICIWSLSAPAYASDTTDACRRAMVLFYEPAEAPRTIKTQDFPELTPPRVVVFHKAQREIAALLDEKDRPMTKTHCEFTNTQSPVGLKSMRVEGEAPFWNAKRVEEIAVLLNREGF